MVPVLPCLDQEVDRYFDLFEGMQRGGYVGSYKVNFLLQFPCQYILVFPIYNVVKCIRCCCCLYKYYRGALEIQVMGVLCFGKQISELP